MKKLLLVIGGLFASFGVFAEDVTFNATEDSFCTIGAITAGTMEFNGTIISTSEAATLNVVNNEAAAYKVTVANPAGFASVPIGYTGTASLVATYNATGANTATDVEGGIDSNLDNVGTTSVTVTVAGSMDEVPIAGNYTAVSVVSCVAQ